MSKIDFIIFPANDCWKLAKNVQKKKISESDGIKKYTFHEFKEGFFIIPKNDFLSSLENKQNHSRNHCSIKIYLSSIESNLHFNRIWRISLFRNLKIIIWILNITIAQLEKNISFNEILYTSLFPFFQEVRTIQHIRNRNQNK